MILINPITGAETFIFDPDTGKPLDVMPENRCWRRGLMWPGDYGEFFLYDSADLKPDEYVIDSIRDILQWCEDVVECRPMLVTLRTIKKKDINRFNRAHFDLEAPAFRLYGKHALAFRLTHYPN